jgi:hypothetical protein
MASKGKGVKAATSVRSGTSFEKAMSFQPVHKAPFMRVILSGSGHEATILEIASWFPPRPLSGRVVFTYTLPEPRFFPREGLASVEMLGSPMLSSLGYSSAALVSSLKPASEWLPEPWVQLNRTLDDSVAIQLKLRKVDTPATDMASQPEYLITRMAIHVKPVAKETGPEASAAEPATDLARAIAV